MKRVKNYTIFGVVLGCGMAASAAAGTLQSLPQSAASLGVALAGSAASAQNADTSYYNPAGSPWIQHQDAGFSLNTNVSDNRFSGNEQISPTISGFSSSGRSQGGAMQYLPALFYTAPLSTKWGVGFSVTSPYQARLEYGDGAFTRYSLSTFHLDTTDISPSVGYRFIKSLAVGFGVDVEYANLDFDQVSTTTSVANNAAGESSAAGWGWGFNSGLIWQPTNTTRVGLDYHSRIYHHMSGDSVGSGLPSSRLHVGLTTPSQYIFSVYQHIKTNWDVLGTAAYTRWSSMVSLHLQGLTTQPGIRGQHVFKNLRDSWYYSGAVRYRFSKGLLAKTAIGYQQAAVRDNRQTILAPNVSHVIFALGANYAMTNTLNVDVGYSHYFQHDQKANAAHSTPTGTINDNGTFTEAQDLFGVQLNWLMT
ncbi:MAG: hypothetical protein CMF39_04375 [Legionellaceae bacterium]|nr:hypothetical protein [Legionellaceae bacterium]